MASSATIKADVKGLRDLAGKCRSASSALVSDTGLFNEGANGIEHSGLTGAVNTFEERWSDKRHKIKDALEKTGRAFGTVADTFEEADRELAALLDGGGGSGGRLPLASHGHMPARDLVYRVDDVATPIAPGVERIDRVETLIDEGPGR